MREVYRSRCRARPEVWLHPAAHHDVGDFPSRLERDLHVVVVPRTGTRRVRFAVLLDADPVEMTRISDLMPDAALFAVTTSPPTDGQVTAARLTGARLLPEATPEEVSAAVLARFDPEGHEPQRAG